jgi:tRNA-dihydrouridine synthase
MIRWHFTVLQRQHNEQMALMLIRKTVCHYAGSQRGARKFRNDVCTAKDAESFFKIIRNFFIADTCYS